MANGASDLGVARRGLMLVLSSPSGAGKTTLSRRLLESDPAIDLSISVTTRKPRPGEVDAGSTKAKRAPRRSSSVFRWLSSRTMM